MIFKNQAVVLTKQKKKLSLYNLEIPKLSEGYVLVKMKYSGICHTQLNEINGILSMILENNTKFISADNIRLQYFPSVNYNYSSLNKLNIAYK